MKWQNEPAVWSKKGDSLAVTSSPQTDFWRLTHDGGIRHNGHFFYQKVRTNFRLTTRFQGDYQEQYDQSGLMIAYDELNWIKCGIEYVDSERRPSAVVTREYSDWGISTPTELHETTFQIRRKGNLIEILFGPSEDDLSLLRQLSFPVGHELQAGLMTASPKGRGFQTLFHEWRID